MTKKTTNKGTSVGRVNANGDTEYPTENPAVTKVVRSKTGRTVYRVTGWIYGIDAFPPAKPSGLNIKLRSKHKSQSVYWEVKCWRDAIIAVTGSGTVDGKKVRRRPPLRTGDVITVEGPVDYEKQIDAGDGRFLETKVNGKKVNISRYSWKLNYFDQLKIEKRAETPDLSEYVASQAGNNEPDASEELPETF